MAQTATQSLQSQIMSTVLSTGIAAPLADAIVDTLDDAWIGNLVDAFLTFPSHPTIRTPEDRLTVARLYLGNTVREGIRLAAAQLRRENER